MLRFLCDRSRHRAGWRFLRFITTVTVKKSAEAEKRLDNSHSMPYNNHCCAGVAHLVERDLAKVEVASSSLVARSKKKHHPSGWCFFRSSRAEARNGTSAARKTCRWHVLVPVCVWRPGRAASEPRRPLQKKDTRRGVFLFGAALLLRKSGRLRAGDLTCKGNPAKVSLAYIPFLAIYRSAHGQQNL